jgi:hypothetical protein
MGCKDQHKNTLNPNLRFPLIVAHSKYKQKIAKKAVAKNETFASTSAVKRLFRKG